MLRCAGETTKRRTRLQIGRASQPASQLAILSIRTPTFFRPLARVLFFLVSFWFSSVLLFLAAGLSILCVPVDFLSLRPRHHQHHPNGNVRSRTKQCPKDTRLSSPHTCELTAQDFGDQGQFALGIGQPTVVEFYKPTCKHCLALVPIYEKIGMEFQSPKPPGNFAGVRTCRFDAAEKDPVTMAIRARFKIKTFPCIRVFPSQWKFGSKGPTWNETFMGEEYDAHITRTVDTVEDFITASLAKLGEKPAHDANVAAAASQAAQSHWTTVAAGFGSFKESRPAFLKEWNKEVQGCPADEEEEGEEVDEEKTHRAGSHVDLLDGRAEVASASASASSFAAAAAAAAAASPGAGTP